MEFKTKLSPLFILQLVVITAAAMLAFLNLFNPIVDRGLLRYNYILYALMVFIWVLQLYRRIYAGLTDKTILTINEDYIYDFVHDVKYYWKDIEGFRIKRSVIFVNLREPKDYLEEIGNPVRRFVTKFWFKHIRKRSLFFIDTDVMDVDANELLALLEVYAGKVAPAP